MKDNIIMEVIAMKARTGKLLVTNNDGSTSPFFPKTHASMVISPDGSTAAESLTGIENLLKGLQIDAKKIEAAL